METIKNLVSVTIPIYNTPEVLLCKCIESIINQTYKPLEIFLVDDGSTNNALEVCKKYENKNIHVFHQDNQGVSVARNVGIEKSLGEWIMFVDPDDELKADAIETLLSNVQKNDDIVAASCFLKKGNDIRTTHFFDGNRYFDSTETKQEFYCQLLWRITNACAPWGKIFKRSLITKNNLTFKPELRRAQDIVFNLYAVHHCHGYRYIDLPLYIYNEEHINAFHNDYRPELAIYYELFAQARYEWMLKTNSFSNETLKSYYYNGAFSVLNQILDVGTFHPKNIIPYSEKKKNAEQYFSMDCFSFIRKDDNYHCNGLSKKEKIKYFLMKHRIWISWYIRKGM